MEKKSVESIVLSSTSLMVPLFIKTGDVIRVDLQAMKYMDRVKTDR
jgi:Elongation factor P, C-terminal